jgi:DNA repair exonuclease SbcCD ATPase subunit
MKTPLIHLVALLAILAPTMSNAETARRDGGADNAALLRAQGQVREMAAQRDALTTELEKFKEESKKKLDEKDAKIAALNKRIEAAQASADKSDAAADKTREVNQAMRDRILDAQDKMQKLVAKYKELVAALRVIEDERTTLQQTVARKNADLDACSKDNVTLYQTSLDLIERYENKGVWDAMLEREPVTQLKRVELENVVQDYRTRVNAAKVEFSTESRAN